jgi:small subunit ribosomal protein S1
MLERNLKEPPLAAPCTEGSQGKRRQHVALTSFKLREVLGGPITKLTRDGVYVHLHGLDWLVHIPELSWGDIGHPSQPCFVGQWVNVKVLSTPVHSQHPFLVLVWE